MGSRSVTTTLTVASLGFQVAAAGANAQTVNLGPIAPASVGASVPTTPAEGYKRAVEGGPSFETPGPPDGSVFAVTETAVKVTNLPTKSVAVADTTTDADGATVTVLNRAADEIEIQVPGLAIDAKLKLHEGFSSLSPGEFKYGATGLTNGGFLHLSTFPDNLNYAILGQWSVSRTKDGPDTNAAYFMIGFQTPLESVPKTGAAAYRGVDNVNGIVLMEGGQMGALRGNGLLVANFAKDTVTGSLSDMTVTTAYNYFPQAWNTVSLSGTISGDLISGTASVAGNPGGSLSLAKSGKGTISGGFYGPTANEVALIWTLHDSKGSNAVGAFGAATGGSTCITCAPSDRRLKREIAPSGRLANGLALYSYAYLGDERRFTGVMAQDLMEDPRFASAVIADADGVMRVDYGRLGLALPDFAAMAAAGERAVDLYRAASA
jgi:hypothetical protein